MKLTFANDLGQTFSLEIDSGMELENVMALLEAEVRLTPQVAPPVSLSPLCFLLLLFGSVDIFKNHER